MNHSQVIPIAAASLPLVEELAPTLAPIDVLQHLSSLPWLIFLDSAQKQSPLARYSFITADPFDVLQARGWQAHFLNSPDTGADPFALLAKRLAEFGGDRRADLPPFQGGAAGLFGYDLCHHIERLPRPRFDEFGVPDMAVGLYDWVIAFDHVAERVWAVSTGWPEKDEHRRRHRAEQRLRGVLRLLRVPQEPAEWQADAPIALEAPHWKAHGYDRLTSNFQREGYLATVRRAVEYIHAGDCFQVNLAQRLVYPATESPLDLYLRLRQCNPAPFAGYFSMGDFAIASASPERFLRMEQGLIEARPIKGTQPRGYTPEEDSARGLDLQESGKDRAENVMIVDLLRNDLGRVCRYGSVQVPEVCRLETYGYVHHLVSVVHGQLRAGLGPIDLLRATFPGGSVTGAPKVRAMEIIAELEPTARGPYCGCLGYIGFDGTVDLNILIRTMTHGRGWVQFPVGGGIVAESVPEREYEETWHKAEGLLRALQHDSAHIRRK
jgi:para-aminobenzoate synthetase component 1